MNHKADIKIMIYKNIITLQIKNLGNKSSFYQLVKFKQNFVLVPSFFVIITVEMRRKLKP